MHTGRLPGNRQEDKGGIKRRRAKCLKDSMTLFSLFTIKHRPRFSNSIPSARTSSAADRPNRPAKVNLPSKVNYRVINDTLAAKQ